MLAVAAGGPATPPPSFFDQQKAGVNNSWTKHNNITTLRILSILFI